jgi:hypothetical protein
MSNNEGYTNEHSFKRDLNGHSSPKERLEKWQGFGSIYGQQITAYRDMLDKKRHIYLAPAEIKELQDKGFLSIHKKPKITQLGIDEERKSKEAEQDDIDREVREANQ